jgi:hypothetical protein
MLLCLERQRNGALGFCNTITAYSFEERMKSRQDIPKRPSSDTSGTLSSAEIKEVCGTGEGAAGL